MCRTDKNQKQMDEIKTPGKFTHSDFQEINWEIFYDIIWAEQISDYVVSTKWLQTNEEFVTEITIEVYRQFEMSRTLTIRQCAKIIEIILFNMFRYKPTQVNIKDDNNYKNF